MPDLFGGAAIATSAGFVWWNLTGARQARRRQRYKAAARLFQACVHADFDAQAHSRSTRDPPVLVGADVNAKTAYSTVQEWQDKHPPPEEPVAPSCTAGLWSFTCAGSSPVPHLETSICEELKSWLLLAASGSVIAPDVAGRLEFYDGLLMRPELFEESSFVAMISRVCQQLDELWQRLSRRMQTCAGELQKILAAGREFVDSSLPLLIFALTDIEALDSAPAHITAEVLATLANGKSEGRSPGDPFQALWQTDCGDLLKRFLSSRHFAMVWKLQVSGGVSKAKSSSSIEGGVLDIWVQQKHKWIDPPPPDGDGDLAKSGLYLALLQEKESQAEPVPQLTWLELVKHLDNFVKFLSVVEYYRDLSAIAGDAGMHFLRTGLHHLLHEVEYSLCQAAEAAVRLDEVVKRSVTEFALVQEPQYKRLKWTERLQRIDTPALVRSQTSVLESIQELRFLSSAAALPALEGSFRQSLQELSSMVDSKEFRMRCAGQPPALSPVDALHEEVQRSASDSNDILALTDELAATEAPAPAEEEIATEPPRPADLPAEVAPSSSSAPQASNADHAPVQRGNDGGVSANAAKAPAGPVTEAEEERYYEMFLIGVAMPFFHADEDENYYATFEQVASLLDRSGLSAEVIQEILDIETAGKDELKPNFDWDSVQRVCRLVAFAQGGAPKLRQVTAQRPERLPQFRGLLWEAGRLKVLEPLLDG